MKLALAILIISFGLIIGLIDRGGMVLYAVILGYFAFWFYLIENRPFFKEFYKQLAPRRPLGETYYRWGHISFILAYFAFVYFSLFLVSDSSDFSRADFLMIIMPAGALYFLIIFLPAIIRARRALHRS